MLAAHVLAVLVLVVRDDVGLVIESVWVLAVLVLVVRDDVGLVIESV